MGTVLARWYAPLVRGRTWLTLVHLLLDLALGVAFFTVVVTALSTSVGLAITVVGIPLLAITIVCGRLVGVVERWRARVFLGDRPHAPEPFRNGGSWLELFKRAFSDGPGWKGLGYGLLLLPWGVITFTVAVTMWSLALSLAASPVLLALPYDDSNPSGWWRVAAGVGGFVVGMVLMGAAPRLTNGLGQLDRRLIRSLLAVDREAELEARVQTLQESRDASVEGAADELRRIERDLHDGAQQRMVSLAMSLGMARDQLEHADDAVDPRTLALVAEAHDEAKLAISELRDLVRGIHPAVLTDRGLDAAVSSLVARCPVPVTLRSEIGDRRFPPAVEAAAYFIVAEALTNVAKYSRARAASVVLAERDDVLVIEVHDDGVGGAVEGAAGGLRNLRDRVLGAEGRLRIASPDGGPTVIVAELPCGW
jgi:signal transduction histidine kinase